MERERGRHVSLQTLFLLWFLSQARTTAPQFLWRTLLQGSISILGSWNILSLALGILMSSLHIIIVFKMYLLIWLCQVLVAAHGIFHLHLPFIPSLVVAYRIFLFFLVAACGIKIPDQGLNPGPLQYECRVSATRLPGKFPH